MPEHLTPSDGTPSRSSVESRALQPTDTPASQEGGGAPPRRTPRNAGIDVARGLAVVLMVLVNFDLAIGSNGPDGERVTFLAKLPTIFQGRASALFVVLAGVGIALMARSRGPAVRRVLVGRGAFLLAAGFGLLLLWPADILHYYGFWFILAGGLVGLSSRGLIAVGVAVLLAFPVLLAAGVSYEKNWDFATLTYTGQWTFDGVVRHILFNGFHPTLPWFAFLCLGWGMTPTLLRNGAPLLRIAAVSSLFAALVEWTSRRAVAAAAQDPDFASLLGTASMPPGPFYILSAGATALAVLALMMAIARWRTESGSAPSLVERVFAATGRTALSLYVAHVIFGIIPFHVDEAHPLLLSDGEVVAWWAVWMSVAMAGSYWWAKRGRSGPLEALYRRVLA